MSNRLLLYLSSMYWISYAKKYWQCAVCGGEIVPGQSYHYEYFNSAGVSSVGALTKDSNRHAICNKCYSGIKDSGELRNFHIERYQNMRNILGIKKITANEITNVPRILPKKNRFNIMK